jgi:hypothetical protein
VDRPTDQPADRLGKVIPREYLSRPVGRSGGFWFVWYQVGTLQAGTVPPVGVPVNAEHGRPTDRQTKGGTGGVSMGVRVGLGAERVMLWLRVLVLVRQRSDGWG